MVKATGERGKDVVLATFHSFCETILKEVDPNRLALEGVDHWILLRRNLATPETREVPAVGRAGTILERFHRVFFALPGRAGVQRRVRQVCGDSGTRNCEAEKRP